MSIISVKAQPVDYDRLSELAKAKAPDRKRVVITDKTSAKKLWDNYQVICEIPKSDRLKFVVAGGTRDGFRCLSIREFYKRKADGAWMPGRDGILIPIKSPLYKDAVDNTPIFIEPLYELMAALPSAVKFLEEMELYDPEHEMWVLPRVSNGARVKAKEINNED